MSECRLILGDCLDVMKELDLAAINAVVTDPPYGINHSSGHGASWMNTTIHGDESTLLRDEIIRRFAGLPMAIFGTWKQQRPENVRSILVWDKGPAFGMGDLAFPWKPSWEEIYILGDGWSGDRDEGVLRGHIVVSWESMGRCHPHQKPVSLIKSILNKLPPDITIFDPFMGSGTTGVAAVQTGRNFVGVEISPDYHAIAQRRIADALAQPPLFAPVAEARAVQMDLG